MIPAQGLEQSPWLRNWANEVPKSRIGASAIRMCTMGSESPYDFVVEAEGSDAQLALAIGWKADVK